MIVDHDNMNRVWHAPEEDDCHGISAITGAPRLRHLAHLCVKHADCAGSQNEVFEITGDVFGEEIAS